MKKKQGKSIPLLTLSFCAFRKRKAGPTVCEKCGSFLATAAAQLTINGHTGANEFFGSEVISGTCAQLSPDGLRIGEHTGTDLRIKTGGESGSC